MLIFLLLIQIITESLPISSSGHVALAQKFFEQLRYDVTVPQAMLWLVHGITAILMLIVMVRYWLPLAQHPWRARWMLLRMAWYGLCAEIITVIVYVALHAHVASMSLAPGFLITTIALLSLRHCYVTHQKPAFLVWVTVGIAQGIAVIPGCSRLALTYTTARWLGYSGRHAVALSFTLALPLFVGASLYGGYEIWYGMSYFAISSWRELAVIILGSCIAYGALLLTYCLMITNRVHYFAWYMLLLLLLLV